jgi:ATP-binding cassette subfamily B protein
MWRALKLGYRDQPALLVASFGLTLLAALPDALLALWVALLGKGLLARDRREIAIAALGLALSSTATWFLRVVSTRVLRRFRDRVTVALETHVARLQASIETIAHQERPELLDRLAMLRNQVFVLDHMYMSLFTTCAWILRLGVTVGLLVSIHPAMAALALFALPTVATSSWRPGVERRVDERSSPAIRLAMHLFTSATTASSAKELRLAGIADRWVERRREAWEGWYAPVAATRWASAAWHCLAWAIFGAAYVVAIVLVATRPGFGAGDLLLALAAGARLSAYIGATVGEIGFLRGFWLEGSRRLAWLEDYAASVATGADQPAPARLVEGIRLEGVSFAYPGTDRLVLEGVDLTLPAGAVVAIVGENGAGKSTLVKLLCKLYTPTAGRILVDGVPLARLRTEGWRARLAGAFQDFFRFELPAGQAVGVGDLPRIDDGPAVARAVGRAGADDVVARLPDGLATQLGPTWPGGVEVSHGQWQKLALARGFMREEPLLLVLDEPTAALDAETEHALFERFAAAAREPAQGDGERDAGRVTLLVSHRFSTVRMADLIVVLDGRRVVQVGSHEELMARGGAYAEVYELQAAAYR